MNSWKSDATKRRDKLSIVAEILDIAKANLSFAQLNDYLKFMLKTKLLSTFVVNGKEVYAATEKGTDFLQRHFELTELLKEDENGKNGVKIPPQNLFKKI